MENPSKIATPKLHRFLDRGQKRLMFGPKHGKSLKFVIFSVKLPKKMLNFPPKGPPTRNMQNLLLTAHLAIQP